MNKKTSFIITTFKRDPLLYKSIESLVKYKQNNWEIIIVDQDGNFKKYDDFNNNMKLHYYSVDYNSGLSFGRNFGVKKAKELECDYVVIGSDSFFFNSTITYLDILIKDIKLDKWQYYNQFNLIGFDLKNCICSWEAKLNLIQNQSFELDFIDKKNSSDFWTNFAPIHYRIYHCDIVRNFFLASTDSLLNVKWDENLKLGEHEDFFWRYKQKGYKVGWTNSIYATKMSERPTEYSKLRKQNFKEGIKKLKEKYNISDWVTYKNLERAK
jgi:glycosyltransferase involved in cell wall biosynthesis